MINRKSPLKFIGIDENNENNAIIETNRYGCLHTFSMPYSHLKKAGIKRGELFNLTQRDVFVANPVNEDEFDKVYRAKAIERDGNLIIGEVIEYGKPIKIGFSGRILQKAGVRIGDVFVYAAKSEYDIMPLN